MGGCCSAPYQFSDEDYAQDPFVIRRRDDAAGRGLQRASAAGAEFGDPSVRDGKTGGAAGATAANGGPVRPSSGGGAGVPRPGAAQGGAKGAALPARPGAAALGGGSAGVGSRRKGSGRAGKPAMAPISEVGEMATGNEGGRALEALERGAGAVGDGVNGGGGGGLGTGVGTRPLVTQAAPGQARPPSLLVRIVGERITDRYVLGQTLGTGSFSVVRQLRERGVNGPAADAWAVKVLALPPGDARNARGVRRADVVAEVRTLLALRHPSIVRVREYFEEPRKGYIVMERLRGGELLDALLERGHYGEAQARLVFSHVMAGVAYLHSLGLAHRDMKLENLLLARPGDLSSVKIADFGFAKGRAEDVLNRMAAGEAGADGAAPAAGAAALFPAPEGAGGGGAKAGGGSGDAAAAAAAAAGGPGAAPSPPSPYFSPAAMSTLCGTPQYVAPEVINKARKTKGYTFACDLWSCGVILYMLLGGQPPFYDESEPRLFRKIASGRYDLVGDPWNTVSEEAKDLIRKLLVIDPDARISAHDTLLHPWMTAPLEEDDAASPRTSAGAVAPSDGSAALRNMRRSRRQLSARSGKSD